jgi:hypothetical protein
MPSLADIYSAIDTAKRKGADFVQNPGTSLQQMLGNANDQARGFNQLNDQALTEMQQTGKLTGPAGQQLMQTMGQAFEPAGMTVYHGSPYKFNQFDASKIGSGEGAQAFGHGIYVAQNPSIAKEYQEKLSSTGGAKNLAAQYGGVDEGIAEAQKRIQHYESLIANGGGGMMDRAKHFLQLSKKNLDDLTATKQGLPENKGAFYTIDFPDEHINQMLDWDKPFAKQPQNVKDALKESGLYKQYRDNLSDFSAPQATRGKNMRGENIHAFVERIAGSPEKASQMLKEMGIHGIKYLDASSRDIKGGTRNMVVFPGNEHLLKIQDINGNPIK